MEDEPSSLLPALVSPAQLAAAKKKKKRYASEGCVCAPLVKFGDLFAVILHRRVVPGLSLLRSFSSADKDHASSLPDLFAGRHFRREPIFTPRVTADTNMQSAAAIFRQLTQKQKSGSQKQLRPKHMAAKSMGDQTETPPLKDRFAGAGLALPRVQSLSQAGMGGSWRGSRSMTSSGSSGSLRNLVRQSQEPDSGCGDMTSRRSMSRLLADSPSSHGSGSKMYR